MIDDDELMSTEHIAMFTSQFQVSDMVTSTEHSDLKNDNAYYGNGDKEHDDNENDDNKNGDKENDD